MTQSHAVTSKSLSSMSSVPIVAGLASAVTAARQRDATAFILDIREMVYLISPRHENENIAHPIRDHLRCFGDRSNFHLHRRRSGKARRRNGNGNGQSRWRSPVRQRQHFSKHGREVPESGLHGLYPFFERRAVFSA